MQSRADLMTTDVGLALERLRAGGLVAIPTETVYGLAADAEQPAAVQRIFEIKGRPTHHPLIIHVFDLDHADGWVASLSDEALSLADACWPGPLTMLLPRGRRVADAITGGRSTVGVRVPSHPMTLDLLQRFGGGLAAPSANRFGKVSPTRADHVFADIGDVLDPNRDVILDGGPCPVGVESTIVDLTVGPPQVLRSGAITADQISRILESPVHGTAGSSRTSGMLASHYSPDCEVVLVRTAAEADHEIRRRRGNGQHVHLLDRNDDLVVAARELYNDLRAADRAALDALVVVVPPATGIGHALLDRLTKAAAVTHL
jgi:L-threonylcarbamoyladenylate synthase